MKHNGKAIISFMLHHWWKLEKHFNVIEAEAKARKVGEKTEI